MSRPSARHALLAVTSLLGVAVSQAVLPDHVYIAVSRDLSVGSFGYAALDYATLGAFTYDPVNNALYIANQGSKDAKDIRRIDNFNTPASQTATRLVIHNPSWLFWGQNYTSGATQGNPSPSAILLNPKTIGADAPYTKAWIFDQAAAVRTGTAPNVVEHPDWTKRIYKYNLAVDTNNDAGDEFTPLVTIQNMKDAPGVTAGNTTASVRSFSWSGDGQYLYWMDQGNGATGFGGFWRAPAAGGAPQRLKVGTFSGSTASELAVTTSGGVDSLYLTGQGANAGGIDKVTYDGTTMSGYIPVLAKETLADFLEIPSSTAVMQSLTTDDDGNIYFNNTASTAPERRGIYRLDPQGRLSRVLSYADRVELSFAAGLSDNIPASSTFRLQANRADFSNGTSTFETTRLLYADSDGDMVVGVWVFKPGDFNRDNVVDQTDIQGDGGGFAGFKAKLTPRGQAVASILDLKYDMNGNGAVDWKDVKILQQFYAFRNGDANIDQKVDTLDFNSLAGNFGKPTGALWTEGDFDGNQLIDSEDFNTLIGNYGQAPPALPGAILGSIVPEPVAFPAIAMGAFLFARRNRSGQEARN